MDNDRARFLTMHGGLDDLTEKEKATLRLIVRGHDAKSAARELNLSVHTINERLRNARRKLDVTSSREAARVLLESEAPENVRDIEFGADEVAIVPETAAIETRRNHAPVWIGGIAVMSTLALIIVLSVSGAVPAAVENRGSAMPSSDTPIASAELSAELDALEATARAWLALMDRGDLQASYNTAAGTFQANLTMELWESRAQARTDLGAVASRVTARIDDVRSEGRDYKIVRFETDFENLQGAYERVTLEQDDGIYKVSGYWFE